MQEACRGAYCHMDMERNIILRNQGDVSTWKIIYWDIGFPIIKISQWQGHLIFVMEIPVLVRQHFYMEKVPRMQNYTLWQAFNSITSFLQYIPRYMHIVHILLWLSLSEYPLVLPVTLRVTSGLSSNHTIHSGHETIQKNISNWITITHWPLGNLKEIIDQ